MRLDKQISDLTIIKRDKLFSLLHESNDLRRKNKSLSRENDRKFRELLSYLIVVEHNLNLDKRNDYVPLIQDFLNDNIDVETFSGCFMNIYDTVNQTLRFIEKNFEQEFEQLLSLSIKKKEIPIDNSFNGDVPSL